MSLRVVELECLSAFDTLSLYLSLECLFAFDTPSLYLSPQLYVLYSSRALEGFVCGCRESLPALGRRRAYGRSGSFELVDLVANLNIIPLHSTICDSFPAVIIGRVGVRKYPPLRGPDLTSFPDVSACARASIQSFAVCTMSDMTGLRQRHSVAAQVPDCPKAPVCDDDMNGKDKVLSKPVALKSSAGWRFASLVRAAFPLLLTLVLGVAIGSVGTIQILFTWKYPVLDKHLHTLVSAMGIRVHIQIDDDEDVISSCTADQPLVERRENVLDDETFKKVQACLIGHPMITTNHLNPEGFNGTRGFVINFSHKGVDKFLEEDKFNCGDFHPLRPFFEAARHPETNGFVMNVLVCDKPTTIDTLSVKDHVDDTLSHTKPGTSFLAHTVSVMYVSVPPDMQGGQLELLGDMKRYMTVGEGQELSPVETIVPKLNLHAEFRGDSYHRVRGYATATSTLRISLVLEQYLVSEENLQYLVDYEQSEKNGMTMM